MLRQLIYAIDSNSIDGRQTEPTNVQVVLELTRYGRELTLYMTNVDDNNLIGLPLTLPEVHKLHEHLGKFIAEQSKLASHETFGTPL